MTISFNEISSTIRVPLAYIEFDNSQAVTGTPQQIDNVLLLGQADMKGGKVNGSGALNVPVKISRSTQAAELWGRGSMVALMVEAFIADNPDAVLHVMAQGNGTGSDTASTLTLSGTALSDGVLSVYIGGTRVQVPISQGQKGKAITDATAAAINIKPSLPVTAVSAVPSGSHVDETSSVVTLTARFISALSVHDIRLNYYDGELTPQGIVVAIAYPENNATNPDLADTLAAMGEIQYQHIVTPYLDASNLKLLGSELRDRWGPTKMSDGMAWSAHIGTLGEMAAFGQTRNDFLLTCTGIQNAPESAYLWAATLAAVGSKYLLIDPARPLQSLALIRRLAPALADRLNMSERNQLLYDGIATVNIAAGDVPQIERQITTYRTNSDGDPDPAYLDVNTVATLSYLRFSTRTRIIQRFPRHKLADDGTPISPGQAIVTPSIVKTELLALATEWVEAGLIENFDNFKTTLRVERNKNDRNRLDVLTSPDLVNQLRIYAQQIQFVL